MHIDILTTFPELFSTEPPAVLGVSIPARAIRAGALTVAATNIRDHADNKHDKTDDRPFGGGPGMVMMCQPLWDAVHAAEAAHQTPATRILLTPAGTPLSQSIIEDLAAKPRLLLIAGHYEGIDERVIERLSPLELSLGDYVLSSGELAALVLIDAIARLLPGVLGHDASAAQDSFSALPDLNPNGNPLDPRLRARWLRELNIPDDARLLDCPHYTRPREWMGMSVPDILLSGDHDAVARWRLEQAAQRTRTRRPDLLDAGGIGHNLSPQIWQRSMKVRDVVKLVESDGWAQIAQKGSHRQFKHPTKPGRVTIAGKLSDDIGVGTLYSILRQAQIERTN